MQFLKLKIYNDKFSNMNDVTKKCKDESGNYQPPNKYLKNQYANFSDYKFANSESIERFSGTNLQNSNYSSPFGYPIHSRNAFKPDLEIPQYFNNSSRNLCHNQNEFSQIPPNFPLGIPKNEQFKNNDKWRIPVGSNSFNPNCNDYNVNFTNSMSQYPMPMQNMPPFGGLDRMSQMHFDNIRMPKDHIKNNCPYMKRDGALTKKNTKSHCLILNEKTSPNDTFCTVPGRMSLLSSTSKYKVNVGEIQRRLSPPECLNASLLGGVLRRAKSKNGGKFLRKELENIGLSIAAGRRKAAPVTLFTSLVEGEAIRFARDWSYLNDTAFPCKMFAQYHVKPYSTVEEKIRLKTKSIHTRELLQEMMNIFKQDQQDGSTNICSSSLTPQNIFTDYDRLTHGYGTPAIMSVLSIIDRYCAEITDLCQENSTSEINSSTPVDNQNPLCSSPSKSM